MPLAFDEHGRPAAPGVYGYAPKSGAPRCLVVIVRDDSGEIWDEGTLLAVSEAPEDLCPVDNDFEYPGKWFVPEPDEFPDLLQRQEAAGERLRHDIAGQRLFWPDAEN